MAGAVEEAKACAASSRVSMGMKPDTGTLIQIGSMGIPAPEATVLNVKRQNASKKGSNVVDHG